MNEEELENLKLYKEPYPTLAVANHFIGEGEKNKNLLTHMKIQKLAYFTHCAIILEKGRSFLDEEPEAWKYGPVFLGLYHRFKYFGSSPIKNPLDIAFNIIPWIEDKSIKKIMKDIWIKYGRYTGPELSEITHKENTAWSMIKENTDTEKYRVKITTEHIIKYEHGILKNPG